MGNIVINRVRYNGDNFHYESPRLNRGVTIIEGSNGSGKSTFMNLIYFAFSGSVPEFRKNNRGNHLEITTDTNNYAEVEFSINEEDFKVRRFFGNNDITLIGHNGEVLVYPIHRSKNEKYTFSDWILEKLDIAVVEIFQGANNFKINFRDLMRLIYHDQEPNPRKIFKAQDFDNIIADSELVRRIIFQLLIGKTFSEYYSTLAKLKETEKLYLLKKAIYDEYLTIAKTLNTNKEELNIVHLNQRLEERNSQLERLYNSRNSIKKDRPKNSESLSEIELIKAAILGNELEINGIDSRLNEVTEELGKLVRLKENIILEVTQITKIIHSHDKLKLFSADTCPYCLRSIEREHGHCVCGKEIDEAQYERFFYSAEEYSQIFKAKQKNVETISLAIEANNIRREELTAEKAQFVQLNEVQKSKIRTIIDNLDDKINTSEIDKVDDEILRVREDINSLNQRISVEQKLSKLQMDYDKVAGDLESLRGKVKVLEINANEEIRNKVQEFSTEYNVLMVNTLKDCRTAKIDLEDYMPIINNGEYREASSSVPIRLMYYLTLLRMSLLHDDIKYPKLLLIDTPETAGIDEENLIKSIGQIESITKDIPQSKYQIILSTAINKYPTAFKGSVLITLTDDNRLLKRKEVDPSQDYLLA